jgi:type II secretory ATPase GspE/PulE/Tfp pilus assembly ATPase PilB-like protein
MEKAHALRPIAGRPTTPAEAFDFIIMFALRSQASDIHISLNQPTRENPDPYLLRLRVYGKLQVVKSPFLNGIYKEMLARMKILASMPTTEVGIALDGQLAVESSEGLIVLRISIIPSQNDEEVVIRILRNNNTDLSIDQLQMTTEMHARLRKVVVQKSGLIVLTGPAGSGKTTTIYSIINSLASPEKKILTAEDPVETRLPFVNHTQVSAKANFAQLSRAFMRQDADVIFIGEVRDEESAHTALQLAQTGHLVITSLHARDALGTISRLEALNVHPTSIATTLIGSLSQRLVASLCQFCRQPDKLAPEAVAKLNRVLPMPANTVIYKMGPGCEKCLKGYAGRLPLFEFLIVDSDLSDAINSRKSKSDLLRLARSKGMRTLAEEALIRVYAGYTDLASVQSYIQGLDYGTD